MNQLYFQHLRSDGGLTSKIVPEDGVIIRALRLGEVDWADVLRNPDDVVRYERETRLMRLLEACDAGYPNFHPNAQSALETSDGRTYYLLETVEELAVRAPHLLALNGDAGLVTRLNSPEKGPERSGDLRRDRTAAANAPRREI